MPEEQTQTISPAASTAQTMQELLNSGAEIKVLKAGDTMTGSLEVIGTVKATAFEGDGSGVVLPIAITDENPTGPRSGNKIFTIAFAPIENSEAVYLNGLKQGRVDDYAMTGQDIEFVDPPLDDDTIRVDYRYLA